MKRAPRAMINTNQLVSACNYLASLTRKQSYNPGILRNPSHSDINRFQEKLSSWVTDINKRLDTVDAALVCVAPDLDIGPLISHLKKLRKRVNELVEILESIRVYAPTLFGSELHKAFEWASKEAMQYREEIKKRLEGILETAVKLQKEEQCDMRKGPIITIEPADGGRGIKGSYVSVNRKQRKYVRPSVVRFIEHIFGSKSGSWHSRDVLNGKRTDDPELGKGLRQYFADLARFIDTPNPPPDRPPNVNKKHIFYKPHVDFCPKIEDLRDSGKKKKTAKRKQAQAGTTP